ncbi:SDR family oxidoreductase [Candidatus Thioglobus sp.]|nr:SDR family oxidoreductase [Candidatus Thioglobus sp.]
MRIGITGASGMLGAALVAHLSKFHKVFATSRSKGIEGKNIEWDCFDLTSIKLLNNWLDRVKPNVVIHCAAIVNIDLCEENFDLASKIHVEATRSISSYLNHNNGRLIYISTDSVFDGKKHGYYNESDPVAPLNVYAKTKLMGERCTQLMSNGLVLRTNIIGRAQKNNTSFSEWVLKELVDKVPLNLFYDVNFSPLHVHDLSLIIEKIINKPIFGLYHCASNDSISKYDFGKKMAEIFQLSASNINKISIENMNFKAERPKNMALNIDKISKVLEYDFPSAIDAIKLMKY